MSEPIEITERDLYEMIGQREVQILGLTRANEALRQELEKEPPKEKP